MALCIEVRDVAGNKRKCPISSEKRNEMKNVEDLKQYLESRKCGETDQMHPGCLRLFKRNMAGDDLTELRDDADIPWDALLVETAAGGFHATMEGQQETYSESELDHSHCLVVSKSSVTGAR